MTAIPHSSVSSQPPERLTRPLREVARRDRRLAAAGGALDLLAVLMAVGLLASLLMGYLPGMPRPLRVGVAAVSWAAVVATAARALRPALRRRTLVDAAFKVEREVPGLNERLSSAVELTRPPDPFSGSPALLRHLVRQAETDADAVRPESIVSANAMKRAALPLAPLLIAWVVLAVLIPRPLFAGVYRLLLPWRDTLPQVLATIVVAPGDVTVAEGDGVDITARINGSDDARSATLLTREPDDRPLARELAPAGSREFKASLPDLHRSFTYRVTTGHGSSPWFTATVLPRPAVTRLDVRYDYPTYTGLAAKVVENSDGSIRAIQGTDVNLTLHAADSLDLADGKSRLTITEGRRQRDVALKPVDGARNVYETRLTIFNSGSYAIRLLNSHGLTNRDDQPRPIVAELDQPPKVTVTAPTAELTVRPDDDVPVSFSASDDFGVAKVEAMVQVEDKPAETVAVNLPRSADRRNLEGEWELDVAAHLARAGAADARRITYWLRATDNRDPDPQSTESAKQTLKIDAGQPLAYRTRLEQQQAKDLTAAIDRAIQRLGQAEWPVNSLKDIDRSRAMNPGEVTRAKEQRDHLATTGKDLSDAADSNLRNAFRAVAAKAKEISESPVRGAAESVARSLLNADRAEPRAAAAAEAARQLAQAREQLEALKKQVEVRSKELQAARELEKVAQKQAELARWQPQQQDGQKKKQQPRDQLQQRQRELAERLQRTIGGSEALREPKAAEQAVKLRELLDRLEQLQKDQAPLRQQVQKQEQVALAQQAVQDLAARQAALNEAIGKFAAEARVAIQNADTRAPDPAHQAAILDRLRQDEPRPALEMQKQSVEQLRHATRQLEQRGRARDLRPDPLQQYAIERLEQGKQKAQQAAEEAKRAGEQLKQAKDSKDAGQLAAAQKAIDQSAQSLTEQARGAAEAVKEAAASDDATAKKDAAEAERAADSAQAAAEAARLAAQQGDAAQGSRKLEESARELARARQEAVEATRAQFVADQQQASNAAAGRAKELADRQQELADATKAARDAVEQAALEQQSPQDVANRQNQLKEQTNQALQQADQLEKLAEPTNPSLAKRAGDAEALLREAAAAQQEAAQAEQAVGQAQQQASQAAQESAQANQQAAQLDQQADQASAQAADAAQQTQVADRQLADAQARKDDASANAARQQSAQARQQAEQHRRRAEDLSRQSAAAEKRVADGQTKSRAARDAAAAARGQAGRHQSAAEQALTRAEDALRDVDRMAASEATARRDRKQDQVSADDAKPAADQQARAEAPQAADDAPSKSAAASPAPTAPEQAMRQAAQGAQEAVQAQQQALNNNADAGAIQQAAAALQQAASAMSSATASTSDSGESAVAADEQAETGGDAGGAKAVASSSAASHTADSRTGTGTGAGTHDGRPQAVQELGISAGDWARLAPLQRQELLNAAQQSGPPSYREAIKNYYVKIARLEGSKK
jgi:hypothetical protein